MRGMVMMMVMMSTSHLSAESESQHGVQTLRERGKDKHSECAQS